MKDASLPLRKAYNALLSTIQYLAVPVPVFYQYLPETDGEQPDYYIVFGSITDNDQSTMNSQDSVINIQVKIHTRKTKYNDGDAADIIAGLVLGLIYPVNGPTIDLSADGLQLHSTKKIQDFTEDWEVQNQTVYIDRTLIFSHNIYYL